MNTKASQQLAKMLTRMDQQRRVRQALLRQVITCIWWLDKRIAPNQGGDAA